MKYAIGLIALVTVVYTSLTQVCSNSPVLSRTSEVVVFVAGTPGDPAIKSLLGINQSAKVDFIRWNLSLTQGDLRKFRLNVAYGEGQPNTRYFIRGGESRGMEGIYSVEHIQAGNVDREIYRLKSETMQNPLSLVKLNDNLFHILNADDTLMVGNPGWSYTLNRLEPILDTSTSHLPAITSPSRLLDDRRSQMIFEGRTPVLAAAKEWGVAKDPKSVRTKWHITLYRDPATFSPTIFKINNIKIPINGTHWQEVIEGKWEIVRGAKGSPNAVIYRLNLDKPGPPILFLVGDENVLFFLDDNEQLSVGNEDFSYTLNRVEDRKAEKPHEALWNPKGGHLL